MTKFLPLRHPKAAGATLAVISMGAGTAALLAADFGGAPWVFAPLLFWLLTLGVPTTIAVLFTASVWGLMPPFHGLFPFAIAAATLACLAQIAAVYAVNHFTCPLFSRGFRSYPSDAPGPVDLPEPSEKAGCGKTALSDLHPV